MFFAFTYDVSALCVIVYELFVVAVVVLVAIVVIVASVMATIAGGDAAAVTVIFCFI